MIFDQVGTSSLWVVNFHVTKIVRKRVQGSECSSALIRLMRTSGCGFSFNRFAVHKRMANTSIAAFIKLPIAISRFDSEIGVVIKVTHQILALRRASRATRCVCVLMVL